MHLVLNPSPPLSCRARQMMGGTIFCFHKEAHSGSTGEQLNSSHTEVFAHQDLSFLGNSRLRNWVSHSSVVDAVPPLGSSMGQPNRPSSTVLSTCPNHPLNSSELHPFLYLTISIHPSTEHPSLYLPIHSLVCPAILQPIHPLVKQPIRPSTHPPILLAGRC